MVALESGEAPGMELVVTLSAVHSVDPVVSLSPDVENSSVFSACAGGLRSEGILVGFGEASHKKK
jgi:hypothetical protein